MKRLCIVVPAILTLFAVARFAAGATVDLTSGAPGTTLPGQSFNETRGADVTILGSTDPSLLAITARSINLPAPGTLGARIYDTSSQALLASADAAVASG